MVQILFVPLFGCVASDEDFTSQSFGFFIPEMGWLYVKVLLQGLNS